jgi:ribosome-associated toxin RatA of RatAB toxin-antitoxin module
MSDLDLLNTAFYEDTNESDFIVHINDVTSYSKFSNFYVEHNLTDESAEKVMKDLEIGSWILCIKKYDNINLNSITIKTSDGLVHHRNFKFNFQEEKEIVEVSSMYDGRVYVKKTYKTMKEYLEKLSKIYGLNLDKQVIYEDDNDFF